MTLEISSGVVGVRNIEFGFGFFINLEKWLWEGDISDQMESAMEEKKLLKELAIVSGLETTVSSIEIKDYYNYLIFWK